MTGDEYLGATAPAESPLVDMAKDAIPNPASGPGAPLPTTKKRLLFIGLAFHRKTGSADFMIELLGKRYEIVICLVDLYEATAYDVLPDYRGAYDLLVCWQVMPPLQRLRQFITYQHAVLFPMADACPSIHKPDRWYPFRNFQIICFSKKLHRDLSAAGFPSHCVQYFPAPCHVSDWGQQGSAFLWLRCDKINCDTAESLLSSLAIDHLHIHHAPDPEADQSAPSDMGKIARTHSQWYADKDALREKVLASAIYLAPRGKEGIGMSFLEAMAMGRCVIAPNATSMNEYITHGVNGILYDLRRPGPPPKLDIRNLQRNALESIRDGHAKWIVDAERMLDLLAQKPLHSRAKIALRMMLRAFKNPLKVIRAIRGHR